MTKQKLPYAALFLAVAAVVLMITVIVGQFLLPISLGPTDTEATSAPTEPPLTLESIRITSFSDIAATDPAYDTACYMLYYNLMDAENGLFFPDRMATQAEGIDTMERLTGAELPDPEKPTAPLTRGALAAMLYSAAEQLGISTQYTLQELQYSDAGQISKENLNAVLWATERGLFRSFVDTTLLETTAVSRLQLAQALIALQAHNTEDTLAAEILPALPVRTDESKAQLNHSQIQEYINSIAKKYGAVGLQVAVIENGVVTDTYVYGWATKKTDAMTSDHKQRVASLSKVVVGITAQLLREDGIIDLDDDIGKYWDCKIRNPKYPNIPITFRTILTHTSSIPYGGSSYTYAGAKSYLQKKYYSSFAPGDIKGWTYNNYAFAILGMTLELAADRVANDILNEKLFDAMGIDAAFGTGDIKNTNQLITLYRNDGTIGRTIAVQKTHHSGSTPAGNGTFFAGGFTSSAKDMAKLIAMLAADGVYEGVRLMEAQSVELMETTYSTKTVSGGSYQAFPMRYWKNLYNRDVVYFHTGSAYGVYNCASYDPETGDGIVVLTTGASAAKDTHGIYKFCSDINGYIYNIIK